VHAGVLVVDVIVNLSAEPRVFENCTLDVEGSAKKSSSIVNSEVRKLDSLVTAAELEFGEQEALLD